MSQSAIVIGSTGVVGREVVDQLTVSRHIQSIVSLTRRPVDYDSAKVCNHVIDFDNLDTHSELFAADMLFSCLGTTLKQAGSVSAQRKIDLEYQYACAKLSSKNGVDHYFLVSSSGANKHSRLAYPKMKGELEDRVRNLPFKSANVFQPSLVLGERTDKRIGEELAARILPTLYKIPGLRKMRPITGAQVAKKMISVSTRPELGLNTYALDELFEV